MPLIETVTAADMRTPQEVAEVANILRRLVRSTGKVRTGAGAARQDVNVSVTGGTRIEIKGVPRIPNIPLLTYNEAMRQHNLLRLRDELHLRGITNETFGSKSEEVTKLLRNTRYQPISDAIAGRLLVHGVLLRGFRGLLRWETQADTYFSREISDRVRVVACLTTLPNIIHSDNPGETVSSSEWQILRKTMGAGDEDTIVVVWGNTQDVAMGASEIILRAREATVGIPSETRQALRDGTNGFERILPGPDRMYPDTDLPPIRISQDRLQLASTQLPQPFWERERWYRELKIPEDLIGPLSLSTHADLFAIAVKEWGIRPTVAAVMLIQLPKRVGKKIGRRIDFSSAIMRELLLALRDRAITNEGLLHALVAVARGNGFSRDALPTPCSEKELDSIIEECSKEISLIGLRDPDKAQAVLMGLVMTRVRGRIAGSTVAQRLNGALRGGQA
jgi:glutamyl-tRNA(Gln) amidotransferase subunit E